MVALFCCCDPTAHIKAFLNSKESASSKTHLEAHLQPSNAFKWLHLTSKCNLASELQVCIGAIVQQEMEVPPDTVSSIQPQHADLLLVALQKALTETRVKLRQETAGHNALKVKMDVAALPVDDVGFCKHPSCTGYKSVYKAPGYFKKVCFSCGRCN